APETAGESIRIWVAGVSLGGGEFSDVAAEIICPGPVASRSLTIPQPLKVDAQLEIVVAAIECNVVGDGREDIIDAGLTPAIGPVDICDTRVRQAAPIGSFRDRAKPVVSWEELR